MRCISGTALMVTSLRMKSLVEFEVQWGWLFTAFWSFGVVSDVGLTVALVALFLRQRPSGQKRFDFDIQYKFRVTHILQNRGLARQAHFVDPRFVDCVLQLNFLHNLYRDWDVNKVSSPYYRSLTQFPQRDDDFGSHLCQCTLSGLSQKPLP